MKLKILNFLSIPNTASRVVRFLTIAGSLWLLIEVTEYFVKDMVPTGPEYFIIFILFSFCLLLIAELFIAYFHVAPDVKTSNPEDRFTDGIIEYGKSLSECSPPKDRAILELHSWSTRPLHLMGKHKERETLGRIALDSAVAMEDELIQASVLIDDLGWSVHQQGRTDKAKRNIEEGIRLLETCASDEEKKPVADEMILKGMRHLADMNFVTANIKDGLSIIEGLALLVEQLPIGIQGMHQAQLLYLEASFIYKHLEATTPKNTCLDETGQKFPLLKQGLDNADRAEKLFKSFAEVDRQAKALNLYVNLLKYCSNEGVKFAANTRLERLKKVVSRKFRQ